MEQEFKMVDRNLPDQGKEAVRGSDRSSNGQMGVGYCRQDGGSGALGWDTRQGMEWGSRHMMGFQTGWGSSNVVGYQTQVGY